MRMPQVSPGVRTWDILMTGGEIRSETDINLSINLSYLSNSSFTDNWNTAVINVISPTCGFPVITDLASNRSDASKANKIQVSKRKASRRWTDFGQTTKEKHDAFKFIVSAAEKCDSKVELVSLIKIMRNTHEKKDAIYVIDSVSFC